MADLPLYLLFFALLIVLPFLYLRRRSTRASPSGGRLPPSPWALPVIDHIHHLAGALPHRAMRDLARRHGPLMLLRLGERPCVIASSADAAREIMWTHDAAFASRPDGQGPPRRGQLRSRVRALRDGWRQLRKICTTELFSSRRVRSFGPVSEEEARRLVCSVASFATRGQPVNVNGAVAAYVADASVGAIIGSRFRDRETFLRATLGLIESVRIRVSGVTHRYVEVPNTFLISVIDFYYVINKLIILTPGPY
jgi:hypothetical protein